MLEIAPIRSENGVTYRRLDTVSARMEHFGALAYDHVSRRLLTLSPEPVGAVVVLLEKPLSVKELTTNLFGLGYSLDETAVRDIVTRLVAAGICHETHVDE